MNQRTNYQKKSFPQDKKGKNKENKDLSAFANKAKEIFLNNSDESVYDDILNLQKSQQIDKVFTHIEKFVKHYADSVTTTQLRNIYNEIVKIESIENLKLIQPHLAYVAARQEKDNAKEFIAFIIIYLIQKVNTDDKLHSFKKTMEAIVAYHKFYAKN